MMLLATVVVVVRYMHIGGTGWRLVLLPCIACRCGQKLTTCGTEVGWGRHVSLAKSGWMS